MPQGEHHRSKASSGNSSSSMSSSSLSSSFSSSAASSMLLPAAPPSISSQSDITSDHHATAPSLHSLKGHHFAVSASPAPRSSSLANMGQAFSRAQPPSAPQPQSPLSTRAMALGNTAAATGLRLKRAFGGRRKKTDDSSSDYSQQRRNSRGKEPEEVEPCSPSVKSAPPLPFRHPTGARQLSLNLASHFSAKRRPQPPSKSQDSPPPPPPPKPVVLQTPKKQVLPLVETRVDQRGSVLVSSPGINPALEFIRNGEHQKERDPVQDKENEKEQADLKNIWRKSDSTMSHHTIRPGALVGSRTSRPVSMAESLQSTHTVVPVNKRLSALVTEVEFAMPEEDAGRSEPEGAMEASGGTTPVVAVPSRRTSSPSSLKTRNRRSVSLNLGPSFYSRGKTSPPEIASVSLSDDDLRTSTSMAKSMADRVSPLSSPRDTPTLTRTAASGIISSSSPVNSMQFTSNTVKGRLAAFSMVSDASRSSTSLVSSSRHERSLPAIPPPQPVTANRSAPPTFRQTAISITGGFAPAAGLAKRAVEKMGRAWGGMSSSSSSSIHSSSSSTGTAPSSYSSHGNPLGRTESNQSAPGHPSINPVYIGKGKARRTPKAPSGSWSITSSGTGTSSSLSDSDAFIAPAGPVLGQCLRGPIRRAATGAGVAGGIVFGRDLYTCVRETAVSVNPGRGGDDDEISVNSTQPQDHITVSPSAQSEVDKKLLESRRLPALVVRCAQHLMIWGIQEEGLFRVSGRPSHVAKIRTEFDTGADYDMSQCTPGDLDPHAVSSIFKAYLRELPEPILTHALIPYFDAAMTAESNSVNSQETPQMTKGLRGPGLPTGPKSGAPTAMRKPPSLTTLAMPNFSGLRPPSESLLNALTSLIARLPRENRDLIKTVTELIKATARNSKETKMPLSNLLLVFCPSLNMSPPLLRVLCEAQGIWDGPPKSVAPVIVDIKRESTVFDIRADEAAQDVGDGERIATSVSMLSNPQEDSSAEAESELRINTIGSGSVIPEASSPQSPSASRENVRERKRSPTGPRPLPREPVSTIYMDAEESLIVRPTVAPASAPSSDTASWQDDDSYLSTSEGPSNSPRLPNPYSPADPSSSVESLPTPSTSSGQPSFSRISIPEDPYSKSQSPSPPHSPIIADPSDRPLPSTPRRPTISGPIHFPSAGSVPSSPISRRNSIPFLSLPGSPTHSNSSPSSPSSLRSTRLKRPSLHLLFSRRSASPLRSGLSISGPSPYLRPYSGLSVSETSSGSTPVSATSMVTAPQSSSFSLLDMPIDSSPLQFGMDIHGEVQGTAHKEDTTIPSTSHTPLKLDIPSSPKSTVPYETPIANRFRSPATSVVGLGRTVSDEPLPIQQEEAEPVRASSPTPSINRLGVLSDEGSSEEDWARSVLIAADADGAWLARAD